MKHMRNLSLTFFAAGILSCFISPCIAQQTPVRENLGPMINTQYDELYPIISADGKTLFFDRKGSPENIGGPDDDIWLSTLTADGLWTRARNIGEPLNNRHYNYVCSALPDDGVLLLGNKYFTNGTMDAGVSITSKQDQEWSFPSNLNILNFKNLARNSEYTLSPDGEVLVMSINPVDSSAPRDLYVSFKYQGATWTEPQNIGALNHPDYGEITPFIAADGKTLYFSSNRPNGYGDYDVYMSRRTDDSWMFWTSPVNLGSTVNSDEWDAYYSVPASGEYAYFVSNESGYGGNDIFRILLPDRVKPAPVIIVKGKVTDPMMNPLGSTIRYERLRDGKELGSAQSDAQTGAYQIALPAGEVYGFRAEKEGFLPVNENIDLTKAKEYNEVHRDLILVPVKKGSTVRLNNIFFEFNKATLIPESQSELNRLAQFLRENPEFSIQINGHTDNVGSDEYNQRLSELRAQAVVDYLIAANIPAARLAAKGFGESLPVDSNDAEEGRQRNRRVEFTIM